MDKKDFKGVGVAVPTPFKQDKSIDFESLEHILRHLIEGSVNFLVILGTTGEASLLTFEEKSMIMRFAVKICDGKIPLVLGYGGCNTVEMIKNFEKYDLSGFDALLTVTPYYIKPSQEGLFEHYKALAENSPLPVILYNVPGRTGINMLPETTLRLARSVDNIIGIKEASGKIFQIEEILNNRPNCFYVWSGDDALTLHLTSLGADGVISVVANAFPKQINELVESCARGNMSEARNIHYNLKELTRLLFVDGNPSGIIYLMSRLGLCENVLRLPLTGISEDTAKRIDRILPTCKF